MGWRDRRNQRLIAKYARWRVLEPLLPKRGTVGSARSTLRVRAATLREQA